MASERGVEEQRSSPLQSTRKVPARVGRWLETGVLIVVLAAVLVHPLATLFGRLDWRADLISHFQEPAAAVTLIACAALARRRPRLAVLLGCLAFYQLGPLIRYEGSNPVAPDPLSPGRLRVLVANVQANNKHYTDLEQLIIRERPDIVGLVEYTPAWKKALTRVSQSFPYRIDAPFGAMGLALWFREQPVWIDPPESLRRGFWPLLHAKFEFAGRPRQLWLVHPTSPMNRKGTYRGYPELDALAERVWSAGGSRIVIGDFNCTDGSPHFGDFLRDTGLRDSRLGFGRQGSWPVWMWFYRLAIDQALVSDDWSVVDRRLGPSIGSDHFPLILDLAPAASPGTADATKSRAQVSQPP
jgi:endonuclease/exonuclease/phosphatase (EEP) superfamily protein YafD